MALCCGRKTNENEKLLAKQADDLMMESEIKETDQRLDGIIKKSNGYAYKGSNYVESELNNMNPPAEEEGQDIFDIYGFGITSWFSLLRRLIKVYFVFACVGAGLMYFYSTNGTELSGLGMPKSAMFTLGNLGYSKTQCDMVFLDVKG